MGVLKKSCGSAVLGMLVFTAAVVFAVFPLFSAVVERYLVFEKSQIIKDSVDISNLSVYNSLKAGELGRTNVDLNGEKALSIYKKMLCKNLKLDDAMMPVKGSVVDGRVEIGSLLLIGDPFPVECPEGGIITRSSIHSTIFVKLKPMLYRGVVLKILGREFVEVVIHVDSEIPLNR